jgi:hypothetical protein
MTASTVRLSIRLVTSTISIPARVIAIGARAFELFDRSSHPESRAAAAATTIHFSIRPPVRVFCLVKFVMTSTSRTSTPHVTTSHRLLCRTSRARIAAFASSTRICELKSRAKTRTRAAGFHKPTARVDASLGNEVAVISIVQVQCHDLDSRETN